jgi:O-antigen/teichoic acid export membrane protein
MNVYGFPLLLANISAVLLNVIDRYSLNSLALLKYVALYTLAFKITSVLKLVIVDSIKLAIAPMMIKQIDNPDNKKILLKDTALFVLYPDVCNSGYLIVFT